MGVRGKLIRGAVFVLAVSLLIAGIHWWATNKSYLFKPNEIAQLTKKAIASVNSTGKATYVEVFDEVVKRLEAKYPNHILPKPDRKWLFVNAGGWMGAFYLLHASLTEYVYFIGTAMHTSGHAGRHWLNITDVVVSGEFVEWKESSTKSVILRAGDTAFQQWGTTIGMEWAAGTWMVEYGRGINIPTMMVCVSDTITGTQDFYNLYQIVKLYSIAIFREIVQFNV